MYKFLVDENKTHLGGNILEGDPYTFCPSTWQYLIDRFGVKSMLDMGSGYGYCADFFHRHGVRTIAVDGLETNVNHAIFPTVLHDFVDGPFKCKVDLIHCQEVLEHVEEQFVGNLLDTFKSANIVVVTHAFPGQGGYHHVNCQDPQYWIDKMTGAGFKLLDIDTDRLRKYAEQDGAQHLARSGMLFYKI